MLGLGPEKKEEKKKKKKRKIKRFGPVDLLTSPSPIILGFLCTWPMPASPIAKHTPAGPSPTDLGFTIHCSKAQSDLGPDESKAQLKWAPATSKDGSDQIHRHQLTLAESSTRTRRQCLVSRHNSNISKTIIYLF
jgi:hypothetical protein